MNIQHASPMHRKLINKRQRDVQIFQSASPAATTQRWKVIWSNKSFTCAFDYSCSLFIHLNKIKLLQPTCRFQQLTLLQLIKYIGDQQWRNRIIWINMWSFMSHLCRPLWLSTAFVITGPRRCLCCCRLPLRHWRWCCWWGGHCRLYLFFTCLTHVFGTIAVRWSQQANTIGLHFLVSTMLSSGGGGGGVSRPPFIIWLSCGCTGAGWWCLTQRHAK